MRHAAPLVSLVAVAAIVLAGTLAATFGASSSGVVNPAETREDIIGPIGPMPYPEETRTSTPIVLAVVGCVAGTGALIAIVAAGRRRKRSSGPAATGPAAAALPTGTDAAPSEFYNALAAALRQRLSAELGPRVFSCTLREIIAAGVLPAQDAKTWAGFCDRAEGALYGASEPPKGDRERDLQLVVRLRESGNVREGGRTE